MRVQQIWKPTTVALVCIVGLLVLVINSESFQKCEQERKNHKSYEALHKEVGFPVKPIVLSKLFIACVHVTASENDGAIAGLSGIAVAIFTFALWVSTDKLWKADRDRRRDDEARRSEDLERTNEALRLSKQASEAATAANELTLNAIKESQRARISIIFGSTHIGTSKNNSSLFGYGKDELVGSMFYLENSGEKPATGRVFTGKVVLLEDYVFPYVMNMVEKQKFLKTTTVASNGTTNVEVSYDNTFSNAQVDLIKMGQLKCFTYVLYIYFDGYWSNRITFQSSKFDPAINMFSLSEKRQD
jgi:hypothetical protein